MTETRARQPTVFSATGPLEPGVTLLEASAGTGKTYSISTLFVRLVVERSMAVERILAVTFTQAATAELTRRIRKRLGEAHRVLHAAARQEPVFGDGDLVLEHLVAEARARGDVEEWAERARKAVESFDRANITTIHGFCQRMLSQHALEAQVPFGVELIEDQAQLVQEITDDFWVREVASRAEPWEIQTLETVGVTLGSLRSLAHRAIQHWDATPVPAAPSDVARPDATALVEALSEASEAARHGEVLEDVESVKSYVMHVRGYAPRYLWSRLPRALERLAENVIRERDLATLEALRIDQLPDPLGAAWPPIVERVTRLLEAYQRWRPLAVPWALALRHALITELKSEYERRSRLRGVWSYDDLLRSLRQALTTGPSAVARALSRSIGARFEAVLIDEFQDTDPIQWEIFETVFANPRHHLYLIGDPKQAIYGFRRADVMTYLAAAEKADHLHTLTKNFRSDRRLVEALNLLFSRRDPERVFAADGIPYREIAAEHDARAAAELGAPVRLLWVRRTEDNCVQRRDRRIRTRWGEEHLPRWVASDIVRTLARRATLLEDGVTRVVRPSDIAVLVHTNDHAVKVQDALRDAGVPAVVHGPRSVFESDEAKELLRVLIAVLDPSRMTNVRAALLTRLLGLTAIELARLEREEPRELEDRIDRLREWREAWTRRSFIEAFRRLTSDRVDELLALDDGERRLANHLQLGELLHLAVAQKDLKPPGLVAWLERQIRRADRTDDRQQVRLETDEPAVEVVTIHKAKGLEYGLVWCPFLWEKGDLGYPNRPLGDFVFRDAERDPARRPQLEIGIDDRDPDRRRAHRLKVYAEQSERLRAFYVALTRAKYQVTIYGGAFYDVAESPLGYVALSQVSAHDAPSLEAESKALERQLFARRDQELVDALATAFPSREHFTVEHALPPDDQVYQPGDEDPSDLDTRTWPPSRRLDVDWRRTSFSGLLREAGDHEEHLQAASDEDRAGSDDLFVPLADREIELADLPGGRSMGNCLHRILELADFSQPAALDELVRAELVHHGVDLAHAPAVTRALGHVLATPLEETTGLPLAEITPEARLPELDFVVPVAGGYDPRGPGFTHRALVETFREFGDPALESWLKRFELSAFHPVRGFVSGSIDLVFRSPRDGRFYLLDWKSNHLGRSARDYGSRALRSAMDEHHYHLQYHIYAVALCRFLGARRPGFSAERDFGGVFYLFLRGMHPDHPPGTGIFFDRPSASLLGELDRLFFGDVRPGGQQLTLL